MIFCRQEVYTLSEFRDRLRYNVVTAAGHPSRAYDMLVELEAGMKSKIVDFPESGQFRDGMVEMWALISNLRGDVAQEYGYEEG